jgi:endonuclease YncB( thermonuclease family)
LQQALAIVFLSLCATGAGLAATAVELPVLIGKVTRVIDGDTIDVLLSSGRVRVRLNGIDAPERDQAGGKEATQWLHKRLLNQQVQLEPVSQDQYDRLVAIVHHAESNINLELVKQGQAWAYRRYLGRSDKQFCAAEAKARRKQLGLWAASEAMNAAPWEFRATRGRGPFTDYARATSRDCVKELDRR